MKKPTKKPGKKMPPPMKSMPTKDSGKVKMAAARGGMSPGAKVPGGSGRGGPESLPPKFGGGKVQGGGIAGRTKDSPYA